MPAILAAQRFPARRFRQYVADQLNMKTAAVHKAHTVVVCASTKQRPSHLSNLESQFRTSHSAMSSVALADFCSEFLDLPPAGVEIDRAQQDRTEMRYKTERAGTFEESFLAPRIEQRSKTAEMGTYAPTPAMCSTCQ